MVTVLDIKSFKWKLECIAVEEISPPEPSQRKKIGCNWTSPWVILHNNRKNSKKLNKIKKKIVFGGIAGKRAAVEFQVFQSNRTLWYPWKPTPDYTDTGDELNEKELIKDLYTILLQYKSQ